MMLTPQIDVAVESAFKYIKNHPKHHLHPGLRKWIYTSFTEALGAKAGQSLHGWLALLAARRVLPIFEAFEVNSPLPQLYLEPGYPHEHMPKALLALAESILRGEVDGNTPELTSFLGKLHYVVGNDWGLREDGVPSNAHYAGVAAFSALMEARGMDLLNQLNHLTMFQSQDNWNSIAGNTMTDDLFVSSAVADTAAEAVMAESKDEHGKLDSDRLYAFWSWWLLGAIPEAYNTAIEK